MNFHWPAKKTNDYAPWYTIARRFLFVVPAYIFQQLFLLCLLLGWGVSDYLETKKWML